MILIPAIDIKDNKVVRLTKGDFNQMTVYDENPIVAAKNYEKLGAKYIHIIDLDGAKTGSSIHTPIIKEIVKNIQVPIEVGGGIRSIERVRELAEIGVSRIILGTIAIEKYNLVEEMAKEFKDKLAISVDAVNGKAATHGWKNISDIDVLDITRKMEKSGIKTLIYTDIEKDGMLQGPNFSEYKRIKENSNLDIIASGGVTTLQDLEKLEELNLYGAIMGKAIYDNKIDIKLALEKYGK